jgi:GNAT superfamily N-acetyltransferase
VRVRAALGLPDPLSVREATESDAHGIATVQVLSWRVTYRGIIADAYIDSLTIDAREARWAKGLAGRGTHPQISFVAVDDGGGIVGFASGGANREPRPGYDAELFAIYLLPEAERRGLGRRLVRAVASALRDSGHIAMEVRVLAENPACRFYESLGGRPLSRGMHAVGGVDYPEVRYGWELTALTG